MEIGSVHEEQLHIIKNFRIKIESLGENAFIKDLQVSVQGRETYPNNIKTAI